MLYNPDRVARAPANGPAASEDLAVVVASDRVYETLEDGRTVLAAAEGDHVPLERAVELGLITWREAEKRRGRTAQPRRASASRKRAGGPRVKTGPRAKE